MNRPDDPGLAPWLLNRAGEWRRWRGAAEWPSRYRQRLDLARAYLLAARRIRRLDPRRLP